MKRLLALSLLVGTPSFAQPSPPAWPVERAPGVTVRESDDEGNLQFASAIWATRLAGGEVAIADAIDGGVRIANARGHVTRTVGRPGSGPGEFRRLAWVGSCGDSIYAWDMQAARVSVVHPAAGYVRSFSPRGTSGSLVVACSSAGAFAAFAPPGPGAAGTTRSDGQTSTGAPYAILRTTASIAISDATGAELGRVDGVPGGEQIGGQIGQGRGGMPRPLGAQSHFAFLGTDRLVVARSDSGTVDIHALDGSRVGGFRVPADRAAPTREQYERAIPGLVTMAPPNMRDALAAFARSVPMPERAPAFTRVLTDPARLIWLVTSLDGDLSTRLVAYRADGTAVATLAIPSAISVLEVGNDHVLGRSEGEDGDAVIVAYRFTRK